MGASEEEDAFGALFVVIPPPCTSNTSIQLSPSSLSASLLSESQSQQEHELRHPPRKRRYRTMEYTSIRTVVVVAFSSVVAFSVIDASAALRSLQVEFDVCDDDDDDGDDDDDDDAAARHASRR